MTGFEHAVVMVLLIAISVWTGVEAHRQAWPRRRDFDTD